MIYLDEEGKGSAGLQENSSLQLELGTTFAKAIYSGAHGWLKMQSPSPAVSFSLYHAGACPMNALGRSTLHSCSLCLFSRFELPPREGPFSNVMIV